MNGARDRAFSDWVRRGQSAKVLHELGRRHHLARLKRSGSELVGPCPTCGGDDRFGVHPGRNVWNCRRCAIGGDAITLVQHLDGVDFLRAVEILLDEAPPPEASPTGKAGRGPKPPSPGHTPGESDADRRAREDRHRALALALATEDAKRTAVQADFRRKERERAHDIWQRGRTIVASEAESYLRLRGLAVPPGARLRATLNLALWDAPPPNGKVVHRGPAMLAGIEGPDGHFSGVHITWIDLSQVNGKALVLDGSTGEFVPAKKIRGSKKGGSILLGRPLNGLPARVLFIGEGIETVLSIREALLAAESQVLQIAEFRSAVDLGNLAGKAEDRVPHPTRTIVDKRGRIRREMVAGPTPRLDTDPVVAIGANVEDIVLIGDGDSEPFATRLALERAAARFADAYPYVTVKLAMAPEGADFNDLWRAKEGWTPDRLCRPENPPEEAPAVRAITVPAQASLADHGALSCPV
ncbi:DUF7146 domain-containing protein [Lichenifustis flavocetrariae]|uniref:CHC2 zinc finger domain-containing protein n=1 Tax=Lichenifustis flavocetrariae TaxID=2949735 RepID=A0AA42CNV8_9HYPH|nr:CHC2 zinc finger domain-containing protein [Lichenifustis flavocetrariae]MCW6509797.1 CHC2 zinc finger domain-containing protein [Lichenifustis flavocetrariae]